MILWLYQIKEQKRFIMITIDFKTLQKAKDILCQDILSSVFDDPNARGAKLDIAEECIQEFAKHDIKLPELNKEQAKELKEIILNIGEDICETAAYIFGYYHEQELINYEEY